MTQAVSHNLSLEDFLSQYGDNSRYELIDGELIDMEPTGPHEQVAAFISRKLNAAIDRLDLPYFLPHRCLVRPLASTSAFRPDVIVLDETQLDREPLWTREPVITNGATVKLVVEVVSTNWQNDYARKYEDYETLGIPEYWIVDYLGIGGRRYIGTPKQPTVTIARLVDGEYRSTLLRGGEVITSDAIPEVEVSVDRLFAFRDRA
ncbi:Uma2 family endonuclease [Geitlerinema sp. CS-897]|nr:Uma2 family endonuclease [Geitlerinema sp. CS-897]